MSGPRGPLGGNSGQDENPAGQAGPREQSPPAGHTQEVPSALATSAIPFAVSVHVCSKRDICDYGSSRGPTVQKSHFQRGCDEDWGLFFRNFPSLGACVML